MCFYFVWIVERGRGNKHFKETVVGFLAIQLLGTDLGFCVVYLWINIELAP